MSKNPEYEIVREYYDRTIDEYDELHGGEHNPEHIVCLEYFWKFIRPTIEITSLLDVGCGTGRGLAWVSKREPEIALYVPDHDPLRYYRSIALLGRKYLEDGGMLYLEINENFAHETIRLLKSTGFYGMEIRSDLNGKPRMIRGRK